MFSDNIKNKLNLLAPVPGCYLMKNNLGEIIYVGKAKRLDVRVSQYFLKPHEGKTQKMVSEVVDFDTIITNSEKESLILEMNLIHLHDPRYNILLKDDKSYPYVQIHLTKDPYLSIARNTKDKKAKYFGPFPDASAAYEVLNLLNTIFPLRKCRSVPNKSCLYYQLGQCLAPCVNVVTPNDYTQIIDDITKFMNGDVQEEKQKYIKLMQDAADKMEYEQANEYKKVITSIDYVTSKQNVQINNDRIDRDIFAFSQRDDYISVSTLIIRGGLLLTKINHVTPLYGDPESMFCSQILSFYENHLKPKEIIIPSIEDKELIEEILGVSVTAPTRGAKLELLQLGASNAIKGLEEKIVMKGTQDLNEILDVLSKLLDIKYPHQIELIDNSHLQGQDAVSAVVVFTNGEPNRKMYRKYKLNTTETRDDVASMHEIIYRRFYRILSDKTTPCDLFIVDGGITQVNVARATLDELGFNDIPVVGLAKDDHHSTRCIVMSDGREIDLKNYSSLFFLLTRMQDEVHRFVIGFHRDRRSKSMTASLLDSIEGIGPTRKVALLRAFGSVDKIRKASIDELIQYIPRNVAEKLIFELDKKEFVATGIEKEV